MRRAGVPVVPGYDGEDQDPARLAREAAARLSRVIKAAAVWRSRQRIGARPPRSRTRMESASARRNRPSARARVIVEKYLAKHRHIEVQVFGRRQRQCRAPCSSVTARRNAATRR